MKLLYLKKTSFVILLLPILLKAQTSTPSISSPIRKLKSIPIVHFKFYAGIGGALYGGEVTGRQVIGPNNALKASKGRPAISMGVAYKINDRFSIRTELGYCFIKGQETNKTMDKFGRKYNYQFKADNFDMAILGQVNLLPHTYLMANKLTIIPYLVAGIGLTTSRPKGWYNGHWESLQRLTNGQIKNKILVMIPLGFGGMYRINNQWELGLDATWHYTLGGSLDGDSRNGISTDKLSSEGKQYFNQYYKSGTTTVLPDHKNYHDLYTVLQIRVCFIFLPEKYKHLFLEKDINYGDALTRIR